ncbi:hypothetical protein E2C01_057664 [Portunus trituberculatus]|uniref:Uncharacterized protein n=1 Tax=Portunus trituberculatus TaxID=210409 RepID=A0A5B7H1R9_PORTR|nr:hypothetical protein [Portunus trituberculatus]
MFPVVLRHEPRPGTTRLEEEGLSLGTPFAGGVTPAPRPPAHDVTVPKSPCFPHDTATMGLRRLSFTWVNGAILAAHDEIVPVPGITRVPSERQLISSWCIKRRRDVTGVERHCYKTAYTRGGKTVTPPRPLHGNTWCGKCHRQSQPGLGVAKTWKTLLFSLHHSG